MNKLNGKTSSSPAPHRFGARDGACVSPGEGAAGLSLVARHVEQLNKVRDEILKLGPSRTGNKIDPPSPSSGAAST